MQQYVAIKVIRNVQKYRDAAMIEIDVLTTLAKHDKCNQRSVDTDQCSGQGTAGDFKHIWTAHRRAVQSVQSAVGQQAIGIESMP